MEYLTGFSVEDQLQRADCGCAIGGVDVQNLLGAVQTLTKEFRALQEDVRYLTKEIDRLKDKLGDVETRMQLEKDNP